MLFVSVSAASAAISVGQIADKPGAVSAAPHCDTGTWAVTSTGVPPRYEIPGNGVLTRWSTYTGGGGGQGRVRLKVVRPLSASTFKVVAASAYINPVYDAVTNNGANGPFAVRIPVVANDLIALGVGPRRGSEIMPACQFSAGGMATSKAKIGVDDPPNAMSVLTWGPPPFYPDFRVSVKASLEPDIDHDGFGDETQDKCLGVAGPQNGCPTGGGGGGGGGGGPVLATVGSERLAPSSFPAAPSGPSALSAKRKYGTKVSYTLNQAASVRFTVTQAQSGRRASRGRCVAPTRRNRTARKCTRVVTLSGSFTRTGNAGTNTFRFTGRMAGRQLKPGSYKLVATPRANGQTGRPVGVAFRIIK